MEKRKLAFGKGVDADVAYAELERIRQARGLTAEFVVDESRPEAAPLHPVFEWDDEKAAHEHRLWQARHIIRAVHVVSEDTGKRDPVYVHIGSPDKTKAGAYERVDVVVQSPDLFARALSELRAKVRGAVEAAEALERAAQGGEDSDRMAMVGIAIKALETASNAISAMH